MRMHIHGTFLRKILYLVQTINSQNSTCVNEFCCNNSGFPNGLKYLKLISCSFCVYEIQGSFIRVPQRSITNRKRFLIRTWLLCIWRMRISELCNQQAGDPEELVVQLKSKFPGIRDSRDTHINLFGRSAVFRPKCKVQLKLSNKNEYQVPVQLGIQEYLVIIGASVLSVLMRYSNDWMRLTHIRVANVF